MPDERFEGGTAPHRIEWAPEPSEGVAPTDPAWNAFSDNVVTSWDGEPDAGTEAQRGVGSPDARGFFNGPETHEFDFVYHMQQWFVDGSGNTLDPSYDAIQRSASNAIAATHTVVSREAHVNGGADGGGRRIYKVGKGGHPAAVEVPFELEDGLPIENTLSYQFEKFREYHIDQPSSGTLLVVTSTSANDTTQSVTIENEGGSTAETVTLSGTSLVSTSSSFGDIDAVELSAETEGDVEVAINTGTSSSPAKGAVLMTIDGQNSYEQSEGDLGVPALGAGSHAGSIGSSYVVFNDDTISKNFGAGIVELTSGSFSVDQGIDDNARDGTPTKNIHATDRTIALTLSVAGEKVTVDNAMEHLRGDEGNVVWTADEGSITFQTARPMSPGTVADETSQAKQIVDVEYECTGISVS